MPCQPWRGAPIPNLPPPPPPPPEIYSIIQILVPGHFSFINIYLLKYEAVLKIIICQQINSLFVIM